jgi:hypothetical protein
MSVSSYNDMLGDITHAVRKGDLTEVQRILTEVSTVTESAQLWALYISACSGHYATVEWLFAECGANIAHVHEHGDTIWSLLELKGADAVELSSLLKVMTLLGDAPADFIVKLLPPHAELATRGRQLRAQLPMYLGLQRAAVVTHCPLIAALRPLVLAYAAPTTSDIWTDGFGAFGQ